MDKESIYLLQKLDCNCNDCGLMKRDFATYQKWENWNRDLQLKDFNNKQRKAFEVANECLDPKGKQSLLNIAEKMKFIFDKSGCIQYGHCEKFNKPVSFIPGQCLLETQKCFIHRKDLKNENAN